MTNAYLGVSILTAHLLMVRLILRVYAVEWDARSWLSAHQAMCALRPMEYRLLR